MTARGPMAASIPVELEPREVNREGALAKLAVVFMERLIEITLGGHLRNSPLARDLEIIEDVRNTVLSQSVSPDDRPSLDSTGEAKLREELKASIIDVNALIREFRRRLNTGQYL